MSNQINLAELHGYFNSMLAQMDPIPDSPYTFNYKGTSITATFQKLNDGSWMSVRFNY